MKTILVPVDFSSVSDNAADYAVELANKMKAKILLFHVYSFPVVPMNVYEFATDIPYIIPVEEVEKDCIKALEKLKAALLQKNGNDLEIFYEYRSGVVTDEISRYADEHSVDLIVMGIDEAGFLNEKIIGSITTSLISESQKPVLVVHENVQFKPVQRIAIACDFDAIKNNIFFQTLNYLADLFDPHIYLLNVIKDNNQALSDQQIKQRLDLDRNLLNLKYSFAYINNPDVSEGINTFVQNNNIDLLMMVPRSHSFFYGWFHESTTKKMAFHTKVPLLAIHE